MKFGKMGKLTSLLIVSWLGSAAASVDAAVTLGSLQVQQQQWAGFTEAINPSWGSSTTVAPVGKRRPQQAPASPGLVGSFPGAAGSGFTITGPNPDPLPAPPPLPEVRSASEYTRGSAIRNAKALTTLKHKKVYVANYGYPASSGAIPPFVFNGIGFVNPSEDANYAQIVARNGFTLARSDAYANAIFDKEDDSLRATGRVSASNRWNRKWKNRSTAKAASTVKMFAQYTVTRDVSFDLTATLAARGNTVLRIRLYDLDNDQLVLNWRTPKSGRQRTFDVDGLLKVGNYRIEAFAKAITQRKFKKNIRRGGIGEFDLEFSTNPVISNETWLTQIINGETSAAKAMDLLRLSEYSMLEQIVGGNFTLNYLDEMGTDLDVLRQDILDEAYSYVDDDVYTYLWPDDGLGSSSLLQQASASSLATTFVPEPSSLIIAGLSALLLLRRRSSVNR